MKKIISLLLTLSLLISAMAVLSSCGEKNPPDNNPPEPPEERYTITEEEWNANMQAFNYTMNGKYTRTEEVLDTDTVDVFCSAINMLMTENAVSLTQERQGYGFIDSSYILQDLNDDGCFNVYKNLFTGDYEAIESVAEESQWTVLGEIVYSYGIDVDVESLFAEFTYDETNKYYVYSLEESDDSEYTITIIMLSFFNGSITNMKIEKIREGEGHFGEEIYEFAFTNVGTTVVEIPAYTVVK